MSEQYIVKPSTDKYGTDVSKAYTFYDEEAAVAMANMLRKESGIGWDVVGSTSFEIIYRAR